MPLHQMPAVNPEPERLDETSVKTIQTKVNNKLDPAVPVRTLRRRAQSLAALARTARAAQSLTTSPVVSEVPTTMAAGGGKGERG